MLAVGVLTLVMLTSYTYVIPVFASRICQVFSLSVEQYGTMIGLGSLSQIASLLLVGLMITHFGVPGCVEFQSFLLSELADALHSLALVEICLR